MSKLRGKKPSTIKKRLKMLLYGPPTSGKTTASINMPCPYLIDCERGAENPQYVKALSEKGGALYQTAEFDDVLAEVTTLLSVKHEFRTVVIDPLTVVYNELCDRAADQCAAISRAQGNNLADGTEWGRHKVAADRQLKRLLNLLLRLDMNVVITSHAKDNWVGDGNNRKQEGQTFDCYKRLEYLFDLTLELQRRGKERWAVVKKTRLDAFPENDQFVWSYEELAKRYGKDVLEMASTVQQLASSQQVSEAKHLIAVLKFPAATVQKWLDRAQAGALAEMPSDAIQACIELLKKRVVDGVPPDEEQSNEVESAVADVPG